jgi:predicted TIM-barrel fold metal-dependent hydrolase
MGKIWAHSGDSHFIEPETLFQDGLTKDFADRMPRGVRDPDGKWETVHVDGTSFRRKLPVIERKRGEGDVSLLDLNARAPGASDARLRLKDLDQEGIWGELVYPSLGLWNAMIKSPDLLREAVKVANDWARREISSVSPRLVVPAQVSHLSMDDAVAEIQRTASMGFRAISLPSAAPDSVPDYNYDYWHPLWAEAEAAGMVLAFHTGSGGEDPVVYHGPGAGIVNYWHACYPGQRTIAQLVSCGALDRHPTLKVILSEAGASWVPSLGDRLNEAYRQHGAWAQPKLSVLPKEILYRQVYASFQHDESAPATLTAMGYKNVVWGSDYPHIEGTFGHTQDTLHELFDHQPADVRQRITQGAFTDLFPEVGSPPVEVAEDAVSVA